MDIAVWSDFTYSNLSSGSDLSCRKGITEEKYNKDIR